jgi:hypothetical protein
MKMLLLPRWLILLPTTKRMRISDFPVVLSAFAESDNEIVAIVFEIELLCKDTTILSDVQVFGVILA